MSDENKDFAEIYLRCYGKVYSYISRMLGLDSCEAEDLTQQVFLIAYRKWDTLQEHPNVPAFLMRVAKNLILKHSVTRRPLCFNQPEILETAVVDSREDRTYEMAELYMDIAHVLPKEQMTGNTDELFQTAYCQDEGKAAERTDRDFLTSHL